jgi:hypothetical protein
MMLPEMFFNMLLPFKVTNFYNTLEEELFKICVDIKAGKLPMEQ